MPVDAVDDGTALDCLQGAVVFQDINGIERCLGVTEGVRPELVDIGQGDQLAVTAIEPIEQLLGAEDLRPGRPGIEEPERFHGVVLRKRNAGINVT